MYDRHCCTPAVTLPGNGTGTLASVAQPSKAVGSRFNSGVTHTLNTVAKFNVLFCNCVKPYCMHAGTELRPPYTALLRHWSFSTCARAAPTSGVSLSSTHWRTVGGSDDWPVQSV